MDSPNGAGEKVSAQSRSSASPWFARQECPVGKRKQGRCARFELIMVGPASKYPQDNNKGSARYREMAAKKRHLTCRCPRHCAANRLWKLSPPAPRGQLLSAGPSATLPVRSTQSEFPSSECKSLQSLSPKCPDPVARQEGPVPPTGPSLLFLEELLIS